jgi:hypothetical protein
LIFFGGNSQQNFQPDRETGSGFFIAASVRGWLKRRYIRSLIKFFLDLRPAPRAVMVFGMYRVSMIPGVFNVRIPVVWYLYRVTA